MGGGILNVEDIGGLVDPFIWLQDAAEVSTLSKRGSISPKQHLVPP